VQKTVNRLISSLRSAVERCKSVRREGDDLELPCLLEDRFHEGEATIEETNDATLRRALAISMVDRIAVRNGDPKAGYSILTPGTVTKRQKALIHPSSVFAVLGDLPQCIVFGMARQTSALFLLDVTPVDPAWLDEAAPVYVASVGLAEIIAQPPWIHKRLPNLPNQVARKLVGKGGAALKRLQQECQATLHVDFVSSSLTVWTAECNMEHAVAHLHGFIEKVCTELQSETLELSVVGNTRVVLGAGGQASTVLMGDEFREVFVNQVHAVSRDMSMWDTDTGELKKLASRYGKVLAVECLGASLGRSQSWGHIVFERCCDAKAAQSGLDGELVRGVAIKCTPRRCEGGSGGYTTVFKDTLLKVSFYLSDAQDVAFANFDTDAHSRAAAARMEGTNLLGSRLTCRALKPRADRPGCVCRIGGIPKQAAREDLDALFARCEGLTGSITVKRTVSADATDLNVEVALQALSSVFAIGEGVESVCVFPPKEAKEGKHSEWKVNASVRMNSSLDAAQAVRDLDGESPDKLSAAMGRETRLHVSSDLSCKYTMDADQYASLAEELARVYGEMKERYPRDLFWNLRPAKGPKTKAFLKVDSRKPQVLVEVCASIEELLQGEQVRFALPSDISLLLLVPEARKMLLAIEKVTKAHLFWDTRKQRITVWGSPVARMRAHEEVLKLVERTKESTIRRDIDVPPGCMRLLSHSKLAELRRECPDVQLLLRSRGGTRQLRIVGTKEHTDSTVVMLDEFFACEEGKASVGTVVKGGFLCVCTCETESSDAVYRLQGCGHVFHCECLDQQTIQATRPDGPFPLRCAAVAADGSGCGAPLVLRDLQALLKGKDLRALLLKSLSAWVASQTDYQEQFFHCRKPDCEQWCRVSPSSPRAICDSCGSEWCVRCDGGSEWHAEMTCDEYKTMGELGGPVAVRRFKAQMEEVLSTTLCCPKCNQVFDSWSGCLALSCTDECRGKFCGLCLEDCTSVGDAHPHVSSKHSSHPGVYSNYFAPWDVVQRYHREHLLLPRLRELVATLPAPIRAGVVEECRSLLNPDFRPEDLL
jgi:hypothetical protein